MIDAPAQYLLRFDDLCPTASVGGWRRFRSLIDEFGLRPILAVVPDNRDPELQVSSPDPEFWEQMRTLEAAGATIGLHGYRHVCRSNGRSLLGMHRESEFAGVKAETQRAWIRDGMEILRSHGLNPRIWVAPRHGFDVNTLEALSAEGIQLLSDGFARAAFLRGGITWIPQQLWGPVEQSSGLWTICIHANSARDEEVANLRGFLLTHANQFTSVDEVMMQNQPSTLTLAERIQAECALRCFKVSRAMRRARRWTLPTSSK